MDEDIQYIKNEVMKRTENKVRFRIYPDGVLGDEIDMLRKLKIGQIQGVALSSGGLSHSLRRWTSYRSFSFFKPMRKSMRFKENGFFFPKGF